MELQRYIGIARRSIWLIMAAVVLFVVISVQLQRSQTPVYEATAEVVLLPDDPEGPQAEDTGEVDRERYGALQRSIATSTEVATEAVKTLPGMTAKQVQDSLSVAAGVKSDFMYITAQDGRPARAAEIANAVALAYLENRRVAEVASFTSSLGVLDAQIAELNERIVRLKAAQPVQTPGGLPVPANHNLDTDVGNFQRLSEQRIDLLREISKIKRGASQLTRPAEVPATPIGTSLPTAIALGALVGLMAGLGLALLCDQLDDRVRSAEEVERLTGMSVLAQLPVDRASAKRPTRLATVADPTGSLAEAARSLRTSISLVSLDDPHTSFMVTSASAGEGKTLAVANVGVAYAQAGMQTLLVSADLRRPRLESLLGVTQPRPGLKDVLTDDHLSPGGPLRRPDGVSGATNGATLNDHATQSQLRTALEAVIVPTSVPGLFLLPAGAPPPNPSELLASARMSQLLDVLSGWFDMVILDTSPVLAVSDAAALAPKVGHVVVVASMASSHRRSLVELSKALRATHAQILGVVLNKSEMRRSSYDSYRAEAAQPPVQGKHRPAPTDTSAPEVVTVPRQDPRSSSV